MGTKTARTITRLIAIGAVMGGVVIAGVGSSAQSLSARETTRSVQRALERLPYYGVFDYMAFDVERGVVTLTGYAYHGSLRHAAEAVTKRTSGVDEVANRVELLPASQNDDRIRWATFYRIYTDAFLSRYAPGGPDQIRRELYDSRRFPGISPSTSRTRARISNCTSPRPARTRSSASIIPPSSACSSRGSSPARKSASPRITTRTTSGPSASAIRGRSIPPSSTSGSTTC